MRQANVAAMLTRWTLGDKLHRLGLLSPSDIKWIEVIVDEALTHRLDKLEHPDTLRPRKRHRRAG